MTSSLLTLEELASRWHLQLSTLNQWRWNGKGPGYTKIGRQVFYRMRDVEAFEEKKTRKHTSFREEVEFQEFLEDAWMKTKQRKVKRL